MKQTEFTALPYRRRDCELLGACQGFCAYCVDCPNKPTTRTPMQELLYWLRLAALCAALALAAGFFTAMFIARFGG